MSRLTIRYGPEHWLKTRAQTERALEQATETHAWGWVGIEAVVVLYNVNDDGTADITYR